MSRSAFPRAQNGHLAHNFLQILELQVSDRLIALTQDNQPGGSAISKDLGEHLLDGLVRDMLVDEVVNQLEPSVSAPDCRLVAREWDGGQSTRWDNLPRYRRFRERFR